MERDDDVVRGAKADGATKPVATVAKKNEAATVGANFMAIYYKIE